MASENEPAKLLLPYLQRADELQKHEPLVAYYCRLYAMERGLKIPQSERTKTTNALLVSLMKQLEKDKKSLKLGPDDHLHLEGFALNVFAKADKQDRSGRADLNTAKTFYAASIFFEILNQFGEIQPDLDEKQKYAAWKAADIRRALKEGRNPVPGPPGGDKDLSIPSNTSSGEYDLEPSRMDPASKPVLDRDPSREFYDDASPQHTANVPPPSGDRPSPPSHPTASYPSHDFHPLPSTNRSENSSYSQPYHHQPFPQEPEQNFPQNYPSQDIPSYSHPNFQSHPSFTEASRPAAPPSDYPMHYLGSSPSFTEASRPAAPSDYPSHYQGPSPGFTEASRPAAPSDYPSHYQGPSPGFTEATRPAAPSDYPSHYQGSSPSFTDATRPATPSDYPLRHQGSDETYSTLSAPTTKNYPSTARYNSTDKNGTVSEAARTSAPSYQYDSNYQPTPEKIAEAHKTARFAVGALAFDDVSIAVDYLKKSLELLTNPSAELKI